MESHIHYPPRTITAHEMERRKLMVAAKCKITAALEGDTLTAMEWVSVLADVQNRMIAHGLKEEWCDPSPATAEQQNEGENGNN